MKKLYVVTATVSFYVYADADPAPRMAMPAYLIRREASELLQDHGDFSSYETVENDLGATEDERVIIPDGPWMSLGGVLAELAENEPDPNQGNLPGV